MLLPWKKKESVLISTIVRNRSNKLPRYFSQIEKFIEALQDQYDFSISIYENDSTDNSKDILQQYDYSNFVDHFIQSENIGTQHFGSVASQQRVINLAIARNKTLEPVDPSKYQWLLIIEPDIIYSTEIAEEIITRKGLFSEPDIYSGILVEGVRPYDTWATRRSPNEEWGNVFPDYNQNPIREFWSTANGICLYNMKPFAEGLKFSAFNQRLNKYDCDTAVICEDFRRLGYNNIIINQAITPSHDR